jgi:hypothetical protein
MPSAGRLGGRTCEGGLQTPVIEQVRTPTATLVGGKKQQQKNKKNLLVKSWIPHPEPSAPGDNSDHVHKDDHDHTVKCLA